MTLSIFQDPESGQSFIEPTEENSIEHRLRFVEWAVKCIWRGTKQEDRINELENQVYALESRIADLEADANG